MNLHFNGTSAYNNFSELTGLCKKLFLMSTTFLMIELNKYRLLVSCNGETVPWFTHNILLSVVKFHPRSSDSRNPNY